VRAPGYVRYVDDFALFADDRAVLEEWVERIRSISATAPAPASDRPSSCSGKGGTFLVLVLAGRAERHPANVRRATLARRLGPRSSGRLTLRVRAWITRRARRAWRLRQAIFRGGASPRRGG
jgi:hypothetical protein